MEARKLGKPRDQERRPAGPYLEVREALGGGGMGSASLQAEGKAEVFARVNWLRILIRVYLFL